MSTLFVGDVHGCARELAALLELAQAERVVLLGDLFTKGPDPVGVWSLIAEWGAEAVLGNHDTHVLEQPMAWRRLGLPWEARDWLRARPLWIAEAGWVAIHAGVHPTRGLQGTTRRIATHMRTWPDLNDEQCPHWATLYRGEELVIHGHDARRGLADQRPRTLGLDTGCVYGGKLSGYVLEEDRILQVAAARVYRPVG